MRIGMDVSIQTCRAEGYMVMDYPVYAFKKDPLNTECIFTNSLPEYSREGYIGEKIIIVEEHYTYNDLFEMYLERKEDIDSFVGFKREKLDNPTPYDLLHLASDLDSYCGISTE